MTKSHQAANARAYTETAAVAAAHSGHQLYGGKKPSSPAPSAISALWVSSGRGYILESWNPR